MSAEKCPHKWRDWKQQKCFYKNMDWSCSQWKQKGHLHLISETAEISRTDNGERGLRKIWHIKGKRYRKTARNLPKKLIWMVGRLGMWRYFIIRAKKDRKCFLRWGENDRPYPERTLRIEVLINSTLWFLNFINLSVILDWQLGLMLLSVGESPFLIVSFLALLVLNAFTVSHFPLA